MTRERELARIGFLVTAACNARRGALVLVGEPGFGKSWLCERAARRASGFRVIGTREVEPERHLAYAGLFDVLSPLLDEALERLSPGIDLCGRRRQIPLTAAATLALTATRI